MKRNFRNVILLVGALVSTAACATAAYALAAPRADVAHAPTVQLRHTRLGTILVSSAGRTLYEFTRDHTNANSCVKLSGCASVWPVLKSSGTPTAGTGVKASLLSSIHLSGGVRQVTYAGHPLYLYSADSGPGETSYVGAQEFGGRWYALNAAGHSVK